MQQEHPMIAVATVPVATAVPVGPESQLMHCPSCHCQIKTLVQYKANSQTHTAACILCLCLCWLCCCVPYCMKSCKNRNHYCPNCKTFLGTYK